MRFGDELEFLLNESFDQITVYHDPAVQHSAISAPLLDQILPRVIDARGGLALHASGANLNDGVALFVGPSGAGKSSLAASFAQCGRVVNGDDCFSISLGGEGVTARTTYRSMRLAPETFAHFYGADPLVATSKRTNGKFQMVRNKAAWQNVAEPVKAIFVLDNTARHDRRPSCQRLTTRDATIEIMRNSFRFEFLGGNQLAQTFEMAAEVAERVDVFSLDYARQFAALPDAHHCIESALSAKLCD